MKLINKKKEERPKSEPKALETVKREKFVRIDDEPVVSAEEKAFYSLSENVNKTFISKNRIY